MKNIFTTKNRLFFAIVATCFVVMLTFNATASSSTNSSSTPFLDKNQGANNLDNPSWPTSWILIDEDPNEGGSHNDYRDVKYAYYRFDNDYLYLRLECYGTPSFGAQSGGNESRYKWFIDLDCNAYFTGGNIVEGEYLLFVEDFDNQTQDDDGVGDVFLLNDTDDDGWFSEWEQPPDYYTGGLVTDPSIAGYRIIGNNIDLYVNLSSIGNPSQMCLVWATDQENPNLEQSPAIDRPDLDDVPIGPVSPTASIDVEKKVWNPSTQQWDDSITALVGENLQFRITVTNTGDVDLLNVDVEDILPSFLMYNYDASSSPSYASDHYIEWLFDSINPGDSKVLTFTAYVSNVGEDENQANACGDYNQGNLPRLLLKLLRILNRQILYDLFGFDQTCDADHVNIVAVNPGIEITKKVNDNGNWNDSTTVTVGDNVDFKITVANTGNVDLNNITISDDLPTILTYNYDASQQPSNESDYHIEWEIDMLASGETIEIIFSAHADIEGEGDNIANTTGRYVDDNAECTFSPDSTAWVDSGQPNKEHCNEEKLHIRVKEHNGDTQIRRSFLHFNDLPTPGNEIVKLRINAEAKKEATVAVHETTWDGGCINWNNAPALGNWITSEYISSDGYAYFNITSAVTGGNLSLLLKIENESIELCTNEKHIDFTDPCISYYYTYTVSDEDTAHVIVETCNNPPVANDDYATVNEDSYNNTIDVLANDTDPDGDTLVITNVTTPAHGDVTNDMNYVYYTPDLGYCGNDSFTYTITDGNGGYDTATVYITVLCENDPPVAEDDYYSTVEDTMLVVDAPGVLLDDSDPDGDPLSAVLVSNPSNGVLTTFDSNGSFVYVPDADFCGVDSFTYKVCDGELYSNVANVFITVDCVNDPPVAVNDTATTNENMPVEINVTANDYDVDGTIDPTTVTIVDNPSNGAIEVNSFTGVVYTPNPGYYGFDNFTYTVNDNEGLTSNVATVTIQINFVCSDEVWVNDDWHNQSDVDDYNPTLVWGYNAFNTIQAGLSRVCDCGIVHVLNGTYHEQILINKNVTLLGEPGTKIAIPTSTFSYTIAESNRTWVPIILAYGGTAIDNRVSGGGTISVHIDGFELNGLNKNNTIGILYRNIEPGCALAKISNSIIKKTEIGVGVYNSSQVIIENNTIQNNKIGIQLDTTVHMLIQHNRILDNLVGILVTTAALDTQVHHNYIDTFCSMDIGLWNQGSTIVNATFNWWGGDDGPSSPSSGNTYDAVTGRVADGYGEQVIGPVHFDPWAGVEASANIHPTSVVTGDVIHFDASDSFSYYLDGTPNDLHYYWDFGNGEYSFSKTFGYVYTQPGVYTVVLRVTSYDTDIGHDGTLIDFDTIKITVSDPTTPLQADADANNLNGYQGVVNNTIQFYGLATGGTPPYTYHWDFGDGGTSDEQNPIHIYRSPGTYTITLRVVDSNGKEDTDTTYAVVYSEDVLIVDANGPYEGIVGEAIQFHGSAQGGTPPYTYHWDFGDGETSDEQNPMHVYQGAGEYTVTLTVIDGEQNTVESRTQVVVIEKPSASVEIKEIKGFLGVKVTINNAEATPVEWEINVTGGFILFGGHATGTIPAETETTVSSGPIIGFGKINVEICAGNVCKEAEAFLFGPVVLNLKET